MYKKCDAIWPIMWNQYSFVVKRAHQEQMPVFGRRLQLFWGACIAQAFIYGQSVVNCCCSCLTVQNVVCQTVVIVVVINCLKWLLLLVVQLCDKKRNVDYLI